MIRLWRQRTDQPEIIRLIRAELIPLSYTASPRDAQTIRELPGRLKQGSYSCLLSQEDEHTAWIHPLLR